MLSNLIPGVKELKIVGIAANVLLVLGLFIALMATRSTLSDVRGWQNTVITNTETATHNKTVKAEDVPKLILGLGSEIDEVNLKTAKANADDANNTVRVIEAQNKVSNDVSSKKAADSASITAHYDRLREDARSQLAPSTSDSGQEALSTVPDTTGKSYVCTDRDQLLGVLREADETASTLMQLQDWVKQQEAIPIDTDNPDITS